MRLESEVVVVGAGVNGLATARALAKRGRDVLVAEQFRLGHTRGSSHGRSRIFRLAYPEPEWVRFAQEATEGWRLLERESGERLLEETGLLELVGGAEESSHAALEACGVPTELLDADEVAARFGVHVPEGSVALLQPEAGIVYADRAQRALLVEAERHGARLLEDTRVRSLEEIDARAVVVTAGAWAKPLLEEIGIELPVVPTRETVAYFHLKREEPLPAVVALIRHGHGFYALRDPLYGLKVGHHQSGPATDPDQEGEPDAAIAEVVSEWAAARFGLDEARPAALETCIYTNTDDERFVLERHGRIVVGSACSGHGFKFAPAVGERLATLALEALS